MSLVLGAPEDRSFVNIFRVRPPRGESTDELARLVSWSLSDRDWQKSPKMSKEIINVARVVEFQESGLAVFGVYRARRKIIRFRSPISGTAPANSVGTASSRRCS